MTKQRQYTYQDHLDLFFNFRHKYSSERLLGVCRKYSEEKTATCLSGWWEFYSFQYGKYFFESVDEIFFFYSVRKMVREGQLTQIYSLESFFQDWIYPGVVWKGRIYPAPEKSAGIFTTMSSSLENFRPKSELILLALLKCGSTTDQTVSLASNVQTGLTRAREQDLEETEILPHTW